MDGSRVSEGELRTAFVKSGFLNGGFFPRLDDCNGAHAVPRAWQIVGRVLRKPRVFAGQNFRAHGKQ